MLAKLVLQQFADLDTCPPELAEKVSFVPTKHGVAAVFAAGTVFEGPQAVALCRTGQATPVDAECAAAVCLSSAKLLALQVGYEMDSKGVHDKEARALYRAGVILGYDDNRRPIPGPNWQKYQDAKRQLAASEEDE